MNINNDPKDFDNIDKLDTWVSNRAHFKRNVCAVVTRFINNPPRFGESEYVESADIRSEDKTFNATARALFELHPLKIFGINNGYTTTLNHQFIPDKKELKILIGEKYGKPVDAFFQVWGRHYQQICNERAIAACKMSIAQLIDYDKARKLNYTFDVILFEPDPTHTVIQSAWLVKDVFPKRFPSSEAVRDMGMNLTSPLNYEIVFHGEILQSQTIDDDAQQVLNKINTASADPSIRAAFIDSINKDIEQTRINNI
jgi:hypothetical protein